MKPKSDKDCPHCQKEKALLGQTVTICPHRPRPWSEMKGKGGPPKTIQTAGYACQHKECAYFGITDASIQGLVGDGKHGTYEAIPDLICQVCKHKFTVHRNTVLYRLKTHSRVVALVLWLQALGVTISALEEACQIRESTIRTWLSRSGEHALKLHQRFFAKLELVHVQFDELWAQVKHAGQDVWVWVATDAKSKIIPVVQ
jgi:hypothetical protein